MILVTGGTGLLGAHLLYDLLKTQDKVRAIKRESSSLKTITRIFSYYTPNPQEYLNRIEWVNAEITDYISVEDALKGVDKVYHCAAMVSFHKKNDDFMRETNVGGTRNIVNACLHHQVDKLIHVSSIGALGRAEAHELTTEETPWKDSDEKSAYSMSKYASELEVWRGIAEGLKAAIINPSVILGPGDWEHGSPQLFSLINNGLKYYTNGTNGYVYVRDVSQIMMKLMDSQIVSERFIVNAEDLTYQSLLEMMANSLKKPSPKTEAKPWMLQMAWRASAVKSFLTGTSATMTKSTARTSVQHYTYSSEKLLKTFNFSYTPIKEAIEKIGKQFRT